MDKRYECGVGGGGGKKLYDYLKQLEGESCV
jgi:hypothetical protein